MNKKMIALSKAAWIVICACAVVFFTVAVSVYAYSKPSNLVELLDMKDTLRTSELVETDGDLEAYTYVTKLYTYETDADSLSMNYVYANNLHSGMKLDCGIVESQSVRHNYTVECFVRSNIVDKEFVKRLWNIKVEFDDVLTFMEMNRVKNVGQIGVSDIKRGSEYSLWRENDVDYQTFIRITVKPGCENIDSNGLRFYKNGEVVI